MAKHWIDTDDEVEAAHRVGAFWSELRSDLDSGQFWADRIKGLRGDPAKRLELAMQNLPLPAAFREAAVAVRAMIRAKRKDKEAFGKELSFLYWLAALRSFMLDYAPVLKEPGFNVVEAMPGRRLGSLPFSYVDLGYRKLELLNKTDVKWLIAEWGEPVTHTTLYVLYRELWDAYESRLVEERKQRAGELQAEMDSLVAAGEKSLPAPRKKGGCSVVLVIALALGALSWTWLVTGDARSGPTKSFRDACPPAG